ncbi:hypothetical protein RJ639_002312 [Escallonia herrerae]|uniref:Reverse transcriptase/retrotransposon-derived protein RNase H-like domain-containing protein n=1 Tax=Escallonia herrerae TaxID=1293975 RepID=A0AA88X793_9ASTE|nr:hypothetical protein RJ639_002312 [Escallonia herrerae]
MAVALPSTHHSHLDPDDLRLRLTSRSSYVASTDQRLIRRMIQRSKTENKQPGVGHAIVTIHPSKVVPIHLLITLPDQTPLGDQSIEGRLSTAPKDETLGRSSAKVLFYDAFKKMNIPTDRLQKMDTPLYEFSNHPVTIEGIIALPVTIGAPLMQANLILDFMVVKLIRKAIRKPILEELMEDLVAIRKEKDFAWTDDCQKSFKEIKIYLGSYPLLSKPIPEEDLFLYLSVTEVVVSTVLVREEDGVQKLIYYVCKVLQDVETRYPKIDKIALVLITSARHLQLYFQSHIIVVLTDQQLKKVLLSPEALGRLVNWSVELVEFDIQYKPRTAIKAQALADFIVKCTLPEDPLVKDF